MLLHPLHPILGILSKDETFVLDTECVAGKSVTTGGSGCLVLKQGSVNQLFLGVFLMFLACLDHKWWAQFHLGIL